MSKFVEVTSLPVCMYRRLLLLTRLKGKRWNWQDSAGRLSSSFVESKGDACFLCWWRESSCNRPTNSLVCIYVGAFGRIAVFCVARPLSVPAAKTKARWQLMLFCQRLTSTEAKIDCIPNGNHRWFTVRCAVLRCFGAIQYQGVNCGACIYNRYQQTSSLERRLRLMMSTYLCPKSKWEA